MKKTARQKLDDIDHQMQDLRNKRDKLRASVDAEDTNALKAKFVGKWVTLETFGFPKIEMGFDAGRCVRAVLRQRVKRIHRIAF